MSGETQPYTIPVTVEWALWGKERSDLEYRLLRCSDGTLSSANFDELLTRYATGTLETLPQVTISWFEDQGHGHHIALSIHEEPADRRVDATGRPVVLTRCFCVPYAILAEGRVSYRAMYDEFRKIPLHEREGTFETTLPVMQPGSSADLSAQRAAALLVTCRPVCILQADRVGLAERLEFIDSVMSLLPYGLRCQLSASTWASSQFWEHKFRLFFSSALRPDGEYDVTWGDDPRPIPHKAGTYLNWLHNDAPDLADQLAKRAAQLAGKTAPVRFRGADVDRLLRELYDSPDGRRRTPRRSVPASPEPLVDESGEWAIEKLLIDCSDRMRGNDQFLVRTAIRRLADRRHDQATPEEQDRYREIIKEHRLLREERPLDPALQADLYAALLALAFEMPLDYEGYCQLEVCAGLMPGQPMHRPLLRAATQTGITDLCVKLLVAKVDGFKAISRERVPMADLIATVADRRLLDVEHCRIICETVIDEIAVRSRSQRFDPQILRSALAEYGYLASVLQRICHQPEARLAIFCKLLRLAYGETLSRSDVSSIVQDMDSSATCDLSTVDLFFALVIMSNPGDATFAERTCTRRLADRYDPNTRSELLRRFPEHGQRAIGNERPQPPPRYEPPGDGGTRRLKPRIPSRVQPRKPGNHEVQCPPATQTPPSRQGTGQVAAGTGTGLKFNWTRIAYAVGFVALVLILIAILALSQRF